MAMKRDNSVQHKTTKRELKEDEEVSMSPKKRKKLHDDQNCQMIIPPDMSDNTVHVDSSSRNKKKKRKRHREMLQSGDGLSPLEVTTISMEAKRKLKKKKNKKHRESLQTGDKLSSSEDNISNESHRKLKKKKNKNYQECLQTGDKLFVSEDNNISFELHRKLKKKKNKKHQESLQTGDELSSLEDANISIVSQKKLKKEKHCESLQTGDKFSHLVDNISVGSDSTLKEINCEFLQTDDELFPSKDTTISVMSHKKLRKKSHQKSLQSGNQLSPLEDATVSFGSVSTMTAVSNESVINTEKKKRRGKKNQEKGILEMNETSLLESDTISIVSDKSNRKQQNGESSENESGGQLDTMLMESHDTFDTLCEITNEKTDKLLNDSRELYTKQLGPQIDHFESWDTSCIHLPEDVSTIVHKNTLRVTDADRKEMSARGIKFRKGRFTKAEDHILKQNFNNYLKLYPIDEPWKLLFSNQTENPKYYRQLCHQTNFYLHLVGNLNRHVQNCYFRARKIIHRKSIGHFDDEESQTLQTLVNMFGNKWARIGLELGRDVQQVRDHYRYLKNKEGDSLSSMMKGKWSKEEEESLVAALKKVTGAEDLETIDIDGLPWSDIADKMGTRSKHQCKNHWLLVMKGQNRVEPTKDKQGRQQNWGTLHTKKLVTKIYNMDVEFEDEINWNDLMEYFPNAGTTHYLKTRWSKICQSLNNFHQMTFDEVRECLYTTYIKAAESDSEEDHILP